MRILLDTHIMLWLQNGDPQLTNVARAMIDQAEDVYVSIASLWEIAIKFSLNKMNQSPERIVAAINENRFPILGIAPMHIYQVAKLPQHHNDPFDRLLIAQAMTEPILLLTSDKQLRQYSDLVVLV